MIRATSALLVLVCLAAFASAQSPTNTIVENAQAVPSLSTLVTLLTSSGQEAILETLQGTGPFTVFAPNNDAFEAAGIDTNNTALVSNTLLYHVLNGRIASTDLGALQFPNTLLNTTGVVYRNGAGQQVQVARSGSTVTLTYGVGQTATVVVADVECSNGIVHVIDQVLRFPNNTASVATAAGLTTLVTAVTRADLATAVTTTPSITVFAPTNQAFDDAGINVNTIDVNELAKVLRYHVVPAVAFSNQLTNNQQLSTLENDRRIRVQLEGGSVRLADSTSNLATVTTANVITANGVVHVINKVLIPSAAFSTSSVSILAVAVACLLAIFSPAFN